MQDALQSSGNVKILKFNVKDMKEDSGSENSEPNSPAGNVKEVGVTDLCYSLSLCNCVTVLLL